MTRRERRRRAEQRSRSLEAQRPIVRDICGGKKWIAVTITPSGPGDIYYNGWPVDLCGGGAIECGGCGGCRPELNAGVRDRETRPAPR